MRYKHVQWTGAMTDVMHYVQMKGTYNVWMDGTDNAQTGATTDVPYDVWTDGIDDAWMGAMTDVLHDVQTDGDFTRSLCR